MKEKLKQFIRYQEIRVWYKKYERILIPAMLIFGVAVDFFTFTTIDTTIAFVLLGAYAMIAGGTIIFLNFFNSKNALLEKNIVRYAFLAAPLALQFTFGALLSAVFIFYFMSGTLFVSWPFVGFIVFLMISNEVFREYYTRPSVQIGVYAFILFTLASIIFPFVLKTVGITAFILSGVFGLLAVTVYVSFFLHAVSKWRGRVWRFVTIIAALYALMNGLYFLNVIPPIPLAMRDVALSYDIRRADGQYILRVEREPWLERFIPGQTLYKYEGEKVYVYTAIFAPEGLVTNIVHHWQYYDETRGRWVSRDKLLFPLTGGANTGYRGYSVKSHVSFGRWRVYVETERGQALGRIDFRVRPADETRTFRTLIK